MSQNFRILLSSVSLILLGIVADHFLISELVKETKTKTDGLTAEAPVGGECPTQDTTELHALKQKFASISEADLREYLKITKAEEKLRKADEMLSKMMQIFVADLGYKISQSELDQLGKAPPPSAH